MTLLEQHQKILYKVAHAYGRTAADRDDLVQEMMAAAWKSFARFDERRPFSTWMYRIALNTAITFVRSERRRSERLIDADVSALELPEASREPHDRVARLHEFIASLGALDTALMLLYLEAYPYAEIAATLGLTETNVATKIARLKQQAKRALERAATPDGRSS